MDQDKRITAKAALEHPWIQVSSLSYGFQGREKLYDCKLMATVELLILFLSVIIIVV